MGSAITVFATGKINGAVGMTPEQTYGLRQYTL
jgi:hypothetical protein